ncbi:unnamed protein product [Rotaria sp. Silwood1]|nr:unnamed protein product [Rotaria sp. Silwood1]CAF1569690.1 unnamed protein product [Rotaria sp. Silwood1]CAF3623945.1 unnamed protein product [Rotaria sp. Silwood1]CAF3660733.1 unnamed protein product [Rotaria sp. Silwood1]CAF4586336.1 unnamed protein product [Rotaria sp. Silwood1]
MGRLNEILLIFLHIQIIFWCWIPSTISIKISPCAKWNRTSEIVAGLGGRGNNPDQLLDPEGIFIHRQSNTLYVSDTGNSRIQAFKLNQLSNMGTTVIFNVTYPTKIYVDDENDGRTIYVSLRNEGRVKKWVQGASDGVQVGGECSMCESVWVDKEKNVYMTSVMKSCVYKWSPQTNIITVVAGREMWQGSSSDSLNSPEGIYVDDTSGTVYVADYANHRIQKWLINALNGTTVAGLSTGNQGSDAESLSYPTAVWVDDETQVVYVADSDNNRIQRWLSNALLGDTVVGGAGMNVEF